MKTSDNIRQYSKPLFSSAIPVESVLAGIMIVVLALVMIINVAFLTKTPPVFIDEGWVTPDSFAVYYTQEQWWDDAPGVDIGPIVRANNTNLATGADTNLVITTNDIQSAETESETLVELDEGIQIGNVSIILRENSDVTDTARNTITTHAYYNTGEEEILLTEPANSSVMFGYYDENEDNDNDKYAMTEAGSLIHVREDEDGNRNNVDIDFVIGESRYGEAYVGELGAMVIGGVGAITEDAVVSEVSSLPVVKLDTEVTAKTAQPLILVGGPAVNRLTAEALGLDYPTYGAQLPASLGLTEGVGLIKLVENAFGGNNVALVVAGWEAQNTRDAANVLKDYTSYRADLVGKAVQVTSAAGVLTVGPVVVTAAEGE